MTLGLEVLVQLVMAAMTTSPSPRSWFAPSTGTRAPASGRPKASTRAFLKAPAAVERGTLSCGRFGPARLDSTVPISRLRL